MTQTRIPPAWHQRNGPAVQAPGCAGGRFLHAGKTLTNRWRILQRHL